MNIEWQTFCVISLYTAIVAAGFVDVLFLSKTRRQRQIQRQETEFGRLFLQIHNRPRLSSAWYFIMLILAIPGYIVAVFFAILGLLFSSTSSLGLAVVFGGEAMVVSAVASLGRRSCLELREKGIRQVVLGRESFVPWNTVSNYKWSGHFLMLTSKNAKHFFKVPGSHVVEVEDAVKAKLNEPASTD